MRKLLTKTINRPILINVSSIDDNIRQKKSLQRPNRVCYNKTPTAPWSSG